MRVMVAMSGGVDSSVAAALLLEQGHEVIGITMLLFTDAPDRPGGRSCCGSRAVRDAQRVAARLGFAHYAWDFRKEFETAVIEDFCSEYGRGRTPNPCVRCNEVLKFRLLLGRMEQVGAEVLATGHYARVARAESGQWRLLRGRDQTKDQSYFLYMLGQEQLSRLLFPVGEMTKDKVRQTARKLELVSAERPDSQDVCFVPGDDYVAFLRACRPELFRAGSVLDTEGNVVGEHEGIARYTLGQRKGLGLAFGGRRYVVVIDAARNAVVLGREVDAYARVVEAERVNWVAGRPPDAAVSAWAKVRSQGRGGSATVESLGETRARVVFDEPQWAPAPGQAVVFWQDDAVLGGGTIVRAGQE